MTKGPRDERTKQAIDGLQRMGWIAVFQMPWYGPSTAEP